MMKRFPFYFVLASLTLFSACSSTDDVPVIEPEPPKEPALPELPEQPEKSTFYFGADLSYVNHILDKGGIYKDAGVMKDPYSIFSDYGTDLIRLRLWHNPIWTKEVYGEAGIQRYNDLNDVEKAIARTREKGMKVLLDFHYSDTWADPAHQEIPAAWSDITSLDVLVDSVYGYTFRTLIYLNEKGLLPEFVQVGNETNCGMLHTNASPNFPQLNVCNGAWANQAKVLNAGIKAVRDASATIKTKIILHIADPKNVQWFFDNITSHGVTDYDIIGFSYYPLWHTTVSVDHVSESVKGFNDRFGKDVMMVETGYPWTTAANDTYNNHFGNEPALAGYPKSQQGLYDLLVKLTKEMKEGGGIGIIYWEPAWISSDMKDLWGTGSSWENCTFFDYDGNKHKAMDYMKFKYD